MIFLTFYDSTTQKLSATTIECLSCASYGTKHLTYISSFNLLRFFSRKMGIITVSLSEERIK